jgi:hypothetical protein
MPLIETRGSGSAFVYGLNSAKFYGTLGALDSITSYGGVTGINAVYTGASFDTTTGIWYDLSGNDRNASAINRTNITKNTSLSNQAGVNKTFTALFSPQTAALIPPDGVYCGPNNYTLFVVQRIYSGTTNRMIDGSANNWLAGSWGGKTGNFFQEGWLGEADAGHGNNWFMTTVQAGLGRTNMTTRTGGSPGTVSATNKATINGGNSTGQPGSESSNWCIAEYVHFNRTLNSTEYIAVETALKSKYGFTY